MSGQKLTVNLLLINGLNLLYGLVNHQPTLLGLNYHFKLLDLAANLLWLLAISYVFSTFLEQRFLATLTNIVTRYQTRRQLLWQMAKLISVVALIQAGSQSSLIFLISEASLKITSLIFMTATLSWLVLFFLFTGIWLNSGTAMAYLTLFINYIGCLFLGEVLFSNGHFNPLITLLTPQLINGNRLLPLPYDLQLLISCSEVCLTIGWLLVILKHYDFLKG